jgi:hypothetical protein
MDRGRFTASPHRAATVPVLAAVRQAKRTKQRLAAGLQQNRFSVVIEKLRLTLGKRSDVEEVIRRYSHLARDDGQRVTGQTTNNSRIFEADEATIKEVIHCRGQQETPLSPSCGLIRSA